MRPGIRVDLECLWDYFLCKFHFPATKQFASYGMWPGSPLDRQGIVDTLAAHTIYTFNGNHYDLNMLLLALTGVDTAAMKEANDNIIVRGWQPWEFRDRYNLTIPDWVDHVDLMEVAPGVRLGLKAYAGRMHSRFMQDLPFDPDFRPGPVDRVVMDQYCGNDLVVTDDLANGLKERLDLRIALGNTYNVDLRSKSDAQIAEAVIKAKLSFTPQKRYIPHGFAFEYMPPDYLQFVTPQMRELLETVKRAKFIVTDKEEALELYGEASGVRTGVNIPQELKRAIAINRGKYQLGIGGLHSQEQRAVYHTLPGVQLLRDIDVKSYYPSLILSMGMTPDQLGPEFLEIYRGIYTQRLQAKADAEKLYDMGLLSEAAIDKTTSDGLKIVLNGTFGKLFSKWSVLYAPELGIRTTITGQLALLMLIEMMEASGIQVISANTDGIVLRIPAHLERTARDVVQWWEQRTGLEMENTEYRSVYQRDVNNYIAITTDGKAKRNGAYRPSGLLSGPQGKSPNMDISADAVVAFLKDGTPIEDTVRGCTDVRKFITVRQCKGGAVDLPRGVAINDGKYLGKHVRWYYGRRDGYIGQAGTGAKVAGSEGATPMMELLDYVPADVNYERYIAEANDMLKDLGVTQ